MAVTELEVAERNIGEIAASQAELRRLEPEVDPALIQGLVHTAYDELMPARVRNYVPLLIVHRVRDILRARPVAA
jgi:hypothetical protein